MNGSLFPVFQKQRILFLFAASSILITPPAANALPLHFDLNTAATKDKVSSLSSSPTLLRFSGGMCLAYSWYDWLFTGVSSDFGLINQYSAVDASIGNYRGTRMNLASPTLGLKYWVLLLKADLQFLGSYKFGNASSAGATITLKSPFGWRVSLSTPIWQKFYLGVLYEQISYGKQNNSASGDSTLATKTKFSNMGLTLTFIPWGGGGVGGGSYY